MKGLTKVLGVTLIAQLVFWLVLFIYTRNDLSAIAIVIGIIFISVIEYKNRKPSELLYGKVKCPRCKTKNSTQGCDIDGDVVYCTCGQHLVVFYDFDNSKWVALEPKVKS